MKKVHFVIVLSVYCLLLLLGGCADSKPPFLPTLERTSDSHDTRRLLRYYRSLKSLPEKALQRELNRAQKATVGKPTRFERMRLILLLSLPGKSIQDRKQARVLLQDFLKTENVGNMESLYDLALLLQGFLAENAHQEHRHRSLKEKLEQREIKISKIRHLRSRLEQLKGQRKQEQEQVASLKQQLNNERERVEALEQQLEAIKTIEKRLEYRSQPKETLTLPEQSKILDE